MDTNAHISAINIYIYIYKMHIYSFKAYNMHIWSKYMHIYIHISIKALVNKVESQYTYKWASKHLCET